MNCILDDTELWPICEHDNVTDNITGWIEYGKNSEEKRKENPTTDGLGKDRQTDMDISIELGWFGRKEREHSGRSEGTVHVESQAS